MKLKELRTRKYVALMIMILIVGAIVGILKIGNMDFDKGKVKVSKAVINNVTSSLSANINEATVDNLITSKGYDEIDYVIKYSLSTDENIKERNVIIEASLDDNEKYASFKDITNGDVTSTVSENRKNIKITVKNAKVNKENELKLVMKLEGAPNGYKVTPKIKIKEVSEEKYTNLNVQNVEVKNNSLTGNVQDEQSMNVSNIELALKKDGETIKKTYTDEDGNYVFSDIEEGEYNLEIDEDIYEKVSEEKANISGSSKLNIIVKEVTPYKIELKKQITEMTIVNGGNTTTYKYGNLDKVQQALRNVKNMTGEVKYKITVQNTGKKSGVVTVVKDEVPEGLTFNKEKNTSWEEKNGVLYNRSLEGITLNAGEKREEGLTLDIESTSEAKTYINKVTTKGEIYENVVYILDGKTYKEDTVLEGEKIKEPKVDNKNFKGWYTDKKYTNKYNFNNEVTKDLVLYGQTEDIKEYTVTYVDNEKIVKTEKVKENGSLNAPKVSKEGYTFKYWSEEPNGKEYDLSTKVTKDITLYSVYEINKYTVTFINEKEKYDEQEIEYGENIKVPTSPSKEYYTFKYWSLEENGDSYDLSTKVTKDITLYSVYDINKYTVTFIDKGKEIDKQELEAGSLVIAPKVSMEGYTFKYWSKKENGKEYNLNLPITRNLTLYSVYEINKYNVEFYDNDKLIKTIKVDYDNTINSNEVPTVSKIGYTFTGWTENNKNFDFTIKIKENKKLYSKYEIIKNAVIFNDENRITTKKVDYNNKVEKIESQGKIGYTFKYWSTTQDGEEFDFNTLITEGITLYAVYNINEYNVNFIDQGNAYGDTQKVKYNNVAAKPETDPIKEGYTFKYWSLEENGVAYDFNTKITKDTTLYSVYSVNNYKVSFVDNGTKYIEDETIEYNKVALKPETDPSKEGHTFKYWSLEENGVAYDFNAKITKDITLYSVYSVNNYKVSFIDNGTKYIEDETIEYNKAAIKPETDPSKVGHTFKYWSLGENGTAYDFSTKITKDTTLYSVYEANEYTVKFMDGDNLFKQEQVKYGLKATKPSENPTKEHNLFKTWTLNDKEYDFNLPVIDNMILRSSYEEIEKPSISHVPTEWTNNKVTVTITSSHEDYKYLYKIDTGEYKEYTGPFDIDYNCTVVAKSVKENVDSITESHDITNIDKIKPIINSLNETNVSGTSFDINVSTIDNESGMKQIHIYKDDLLETTIVYNENYNEEKNSTYTFNDLVSGKDYKIKVIAEDVAGNLSEAKEITVKTEEKIVARIIGRENKLFEDENLYENFSSLERAIKACPSNQCTIEMVTDTKESVEVLEGQDITLNINGKTITGVKDTYTINNGGNLIIKDNAEEAGSIVNNAGVALKNETTGVLTLGELEDELVVSTTKPYINGGTFGVVNEYIDKNTKGRFNFYDGMIAGNIAIEGEVNDKPYLYNASVVTSDNRQVATLKILEDAEARIVRTGVYYTKIDKAVEDTNSGTLSEPTTTNTNLMQGFSNVDDTGFTYDSETNTLSSEPGKSVKAYTVIDLTGYENDQYLFISSDAIDTYYGNFEVIVRENDIYGNNISQTKTTDNTTKRDNYKFYLTKGKKYYVRLDYTTYSQNETNMVTIYDMFLQKINKYVVDENTVLETVSNSYGFEYDKTTRTLKSNNQYQNGTTAFSYIEVDLTNEDEDKEVIINASLDTLYYSNYGNIVIREDNTKLSSASYSELGYLSVNNNIQHYVGPYNYSQVLEKGKKYYIQFYYFKSYDSYSESDYKKYDSKDQFIINSIDVVGIGDKENIDLSTSLKTNYYGIDSYDSSYDRYSISSNAPYGEKFDSYVKVDLTESKTDKIIDFNLALNSYSSIYITSNNKDSKKELIINNMNNTLLSFFSNYSYYINGNSNYYDFRDYKYVLPKGSVYYVHFASYNPEGKPYPYIKNISLIPVTDNMINIGTLSHLKGTIDDSNKSTDTNLPYVTDDGTVDSNFRFIGKDTKNYVKFNNELWRVIGIFNTTDADGNYAKRIKIVRNDSIGSGIVWDSSSSKVNSGNGVNEWSQSAVMKLLNPGYENNKVTHDSGTEIVTNNSLYWNKTSGSCLSSGGLSTSSCDFTSMGLSDSSKLMIDSVLWNTGAITNDTQNITPNQMYTYERGDKNGKTNFDASNYPTVDSVDRTTTWFGKVGLPYPSDYIMASGDGSGNDRSKCMSSNPNVYGDCSSNNNWMGVNLSSPLMTMSPVYGAAFPSFTTSMITSLYTMPAVNNNYVLKPAVYLNPKVKITSGSGTQSDPFNIELGEEANTTLYYGLVPDLLNDDVKDEETEIKDEDETLDYTYLKNEPLYGFAYDNEEGIFTNENKGIANTTAVSYIKIDLTNATSDMPIDINYNISKNDYYSMGFINLMKNSLTKINYNNSSSYSKDSLLVTSNKSSSGTISKVLEKGNIYYLQFAYEKDGNLPVSDTNADSFEIGITYLNDDDKTNDYIRYDGVTTTLNKEADTVQLIKDLNISNSLQIESTKSVELDLNGHTLTTTSSDPVITNNGSLKVTDSKYVPTYANRIEDFNSQISDFKTVKYDTSDFSIFCNNSTSTKKCSYNSFSYGNISISSKETYMNSTFSNYKINFDSKYKSIVGTITLPKASSSFGYVTIGLSSDKNVNESSFDVQKRFVRTSTAAQTFNFELKPTKIGEYYLKICLPRTQISLRINEINSKIDIPTLSDSDYVSSIYSSASSAIKNNEGAYLSVEKTLVYTKDNSTSSSGVDNYGKLSIGNGGYVRAYAYGVNNRETGEIVEGSGTIASTSNYSLYTKSIKKNNIKGYTFVGGSIYNQSNSDLTLDNVIIRDYNYSSAIIDSSIYKLTINNSSIIVPSSTSSYAFKLSEKGMLEINNSNIYGSQAIDNGIKNSYSMGKKDIKINNSYIEGTVSSNTNKKVEINNSTLGDIYNGSSTIDIKDSTINSIDFNSCTLNMDNVIIQSMSLFKNSNSTVTMKNMDMVNTKIENSKNMTIEENVTAMNITNYAGGEFKYNNSKINGILSNRGNANINNTQFADGTIQNLGILTAGNTTMTSTKSNLTAVTNEGTLNLNDGFKILNYKKGIYGKGSTINLGSDDETVSSDNIIIDTIDYSIETINESIVNYYDGTLISDNEEVINAPINLVPNGYDVDYSNTNDINKISLNKIIDKDYVAQIGETKYKTLSEAIENVNSDNNQTKIKIIKDIYTVLNSTVDSNKNIELNLDDKKIVYYKKQNPLIVNNGTLKLKTSDSSLEISRVYGESLLENNGTLENNGINLKCYYSNINTFINNGNMNFNSGSIVHNFSGNYKTSKPMRFITNNSKLNVSGGTFSIRNISNDTDNIIYTSSDATTNINDGNFEVGYIAVYSDGITNITGGTFKTSYAIKTSANGNVDVSGGNYSEANNLIYNSGIAKIHDLNSLLKYIGTNDNSIEFTNNVFSTNNYNVFTNNGNSAIFNNNNITSTSMVTSTYGILNFKKGNVIVNGGKYVAACVPFQLTGTANITVTGSNVSSSGNSAIYSTTTGDVNIVSGTYTSADGIAIRNTSENTITFGIKGDTNDDGSLNVSISNPEITGTTAGIKTGSKTVFKFYDGIFTGTTPIDGNVYDTEDEYTVIQVDNSKYLHKDEKETMVARNVDTEKEYSTLQKAIDEATDGNTIQVISEISTLASAEATVVPEGLNVTIDVNGYKINENNALFLSNLGELTITNSNYNETTPSIDDGGIYNTGGSNVIDNSGILKLNKIYIESTVECEMISNKVNGELNIKESILYNSYGKTSSNSVIFNSGTATVDSIKINTSGKSITNNGTINISNSQIRSSDALTNDGILVSENDNITGPITNSSTFTANNITIPSSSTITNTKDFTLNKGTIEYVGLIKNESNMNITGVTITSSSYGCIIKNYGSNSPILNISNSNITSKYYDMADDELHSLDILTGQLILNNTNITRDPRFSNQTTTDSDATEFGLIRTYDAKSVEIIGGIFNFKFGKFLTVINPETTVKVDGATINTYNGIFMQSKHVGNTINLKNVEMKNQKYNILNCNSYYSSVNCGKFSPKFSSYSGGLKLSIEGGNYSGAVDTVILSDYDNITLNNTEIDGNIKGYQSGVSITSSTVNNIVGVSRVTMESGTLSSIYDMYSYTSTPTVIIKSGTVAGSISTMKNQSDMNVTLGIKGDSNVSITDPMISGRITATYLNLYFYDGIVKKNISKPIEVENGYNVKVSTDGYYLVDTPVIKNTTSNKEYNNIRSAVNEISNNDTLQLLDNVWIYTNKIDGGIVNENKNMTFDINGKKIYTPNIPFINNGTVTIIDNASSGKIDYDSPIENNGTMNITSGDFAVTNNGIVNNNGGTVSGTNSSNGTFTQNSGIINSVENSGTINVIDGTVKDLTSNNIANITGGTLNKIINTGQLKIQNATAKGLVLNNNSGSSIIDTLSGTAYISNNSTLTVSNSTLNSVNSSNRVFNNRYKGTLNITSGNYTSGSTECIYNDEGVLNIGEKGGVISITSPVIQGSKYAVNNAGTFNLYDGKLIGGTAPVSGTITEIEPGYKLSISDDTTNNTKVGYLVVIADDERVAMVNGINFTSLQTAINSVKDNTESNIVIYKDIELTEDIIVPENKIINLYLNGHTITYGDYSFVKNGTLTIIDSAPSESIGASIINTIEKVLNINQNGKNIIVYEMSDGSKLSTENTYNLYKKVDNEYKLLNMEKDEEVGRYITGSNNSEMTSIKGRIYLNNLEEGSYKLVSSDNKDIEFTITEDGKVNGNILENTNEKRKVIESALAYLIITIQTGVNQIKYIIYIVAMVSIILGLYFAFKEQRKLSRKV